MVYALSARQCEDDQTDVIFFGPDGSGGKGDESPKIFLRALLVANSTRGRVIESMHLAVARDQSMQTFNVWVYGDEKLVRGSGLFVGQTGFSANHHFLAPPDAASYRFVEGRYTVNVLAVLLGDQKQRLLFSQTLEVTADIAASLADGKSGCYWDWAPDSAAYIPHVRIAPIGLVS